MVATGKQEGAGSAQGYVQSELGGRFSEEYRRIMGSRCSVAERSRATDVTEQLHVREKLVRCLWFDQFLDLGNLETEEGRKVAVFSPGYWNEGSGPDFRNAEIAFGGGVRVRGDVEVHVVASDWNRHGHGEDPGYARVVLHVVLYNDQRLSTASHGDQRIPQLTLANHLSTDLAEIIQSLDPDGYPRLGVGREGTCCRSIRAFGRSIQWIMRFLDIAGDERILTKAARFEAQMEESTPDDVLYQALMETMGYGANRNGFRRLAGIISLEHLRRFVPQDADYGERLLAVQALLLGGAGFLDSVSTKLLDAESTAYLDALKRVWNSGPRQSFRPPPEPPTWRLKRTRPTNHPVRRIAGISAFLASQIQSGLCRSVMTAVEQVAPGEAEKVRCRQLMEKVQSLFKDEAQGYWAKRISFGPVCLSRPTRLIGRARATEMVVNVIIPVLLALARRGGQPRLEQHLHNAYCSFRPVTDNSVTRYMKTRIFGEVRKGAQAVRTLRRQQGLLQIFHEFCESDTMTCEECGLLAAVEGRAG